MDVLLLVGLGILILLVGVLFTVVLKSRLGTPSSTIEASLRQEFLNFQSSIHQELNQAKSSVEGAKDVISSHAVQTINQIRDVSGTLQKLIQQQEEAQKLGQSLKDLLQAPKLRGSYGEAILEEMLERVLPRGVWERQYRIDGVEMVDCVVCFKDVVVPIDAKFPRDDYIRYIEANDSEEKAMCWREFERAVRAQIASISSKYIKPEAGTSEFALMFIPSEAIYYETIAERNHLGLTSRLMEYAQEHRVIPVSPNTLYAYLQIVVLGIRNLEIVQGAKQLQQGLRELERSFELFYKKYEEIGRNLDKASEAYRIGSGHIERYKGKLDSALNLRDFDQLDDTGSMPVDLIGQNERGDK